MIDKLPPQNIYAEESILSSVLYNSDSIDDISLSPADFYKPAHITIFQSMLDLQNKNIEIDIISIVEHLKELNKLESVGGATYISGFLDIPISGNVEYHCNKVKESAKLRKLIEISAHTMSDCYNKSKNPTDIIEDTQKIISELNTEDVEKTSIKDIVSSTIEHLELIKENDGIISGIPTGFSIFDDHTSGLQNSDFILIGARPSMGKTALAMNIVKYATFMNYPTLVFSLEMPKEHLTHRILSDMASINGMKFRNAQFSNSEWDKINHVSSRLYEYPLHIVDNSGLNINQILSISRSFKRKYGICLIMIDYIQLIKGWNKDGQGSKSEISRSIKLLAKSLNIPVIALSQLSRGLEMRDDKRPRMSDLREAGALEQDADIIAFLYRHEVYETKKEKEASKGLYKGKTELLIRKNRQGSIGKINLHFVPEFTRFQNVHKENR